MVTLTEGIARWVQSWFQMLTSFPPKATSAWASDALPSLSKHDEHTTGFWWSTLKCRWGHVKLKRGKWSSAIKIYTNVKHWLVLSFTWTCCEKPQKWQWPLTAGWPQCSLPHAHHPQTSHILRCPWESGSKSEIWESNSQTSANRP